MTADLDRLPQECRVRVCHDCCCGTASKHPDVDHAALFDRLTARTVGRAEVSVTTCLLACERSNVVVVSPSGDGRRAGGRPVWLMRVLDAATVDAVAEWLSRGGPGLSEIPPALRQHETTPPAFEGVGLQEEPVSW